MSRDAEATDFREGDHVLYVPGHAHGDARHTDCERGIVSSTNEKNVFVRYYSKHGPLKETPQATTPTDLIIVKRA